MKKTALCVMTAGLLLTLQPLQSKAISAPASSSFDASKPIEASEANHLLVRLNQINDMDKSNLKSSEKKNLRKEVRSIQNRLTPAGGGVYISVGAVILIVLLLIILF